MPAINQALLAKIQAKLGVTKGSAYAAVADRASATLLPRHLAAVALAADLGINVNKAAYATDDERRQIRAASLSGSPPAASQQPPTAARRQRVKRVARQKVPARKSNSVMVVHGRDFDVRDSMYAFLRALDLNPMEFSHGVKATKKGAPVVGEVLDAMFQRAAAVVVVLTPDDQAKLKTKFRKPSDAGYESVLTGQARPNVLFEAGRAFGSHPMNTILVRVGTHRPMSDLAGVHFVDLDDEPATRNDLATRLETAGCAVNKAGGDWLKVGKFKVRGS
jgi:predicted nucleotide-binding protein